MFEPFVSKPFSLLIIYSGIIADVIFGDKDHPLHPIRLMGAAISFGEKRARLLKTTPFRAGLIMSTVLIMSTYLLVSILASILASISFIFYLAFSIGCIYFSLCLKCLSQEALKVLEPLEKGDLALARKRLSMLVSRQTSHMDETAVCRSLIETVSENFVDGICSPVFYAVVGGPPMCMAFKMASTLDSMIGYRNKTYEQFGKAAARIDDVANFIPARLSAVVISFAGLFFNGTSPVRSLVKTLADAKVHKSPNSGFPEAAFAQVLGVSLGGPTVYGTALYNLPYINEKGRPPVARDVRNAIRLLYISSGIFYLLPLLIAVLI